MLLIVVLFVSVFNVGYSVDIKIVGGQTVDIKDYPYQVSLMRSNTHYCGGTIIGSRLVVTAAHCTDGLSADDFKVRVGSSMIGQGGQVIKVKSIHQNSKYDKDTIDYDVSVLVLSSDISHEYASPVSLANDTNSYTAGTLVTITGWGVTAENGHPASQLQMIQVGIISDDTCKATYGSSTITKRMFCAGTLAGGKDSCQGDSGGPLVVDNVLYGIVSWGKGCARPGYPGVYSKVAELKSFIDSVNSAYCINVSIVILVISLLSNFIF